MSTSNTLLRNRRFTILDVCRYTTFNCWKGWFIEACLANALIIWGTPLSVLTYTFAILESVVRITICSSSTFSAGNLSFKIIKSITWALNAIWKFCCFLILPKCSFRTFYWWRAALRTIVTRGTFISTFWVKIYRIFHARIVLAHKPCLAIVALAIPKILTRFTHCWCNLCPCRIAGPRFASISLSHIASNGPWSAHRTVEILGAILE